MKKTISFLLAMLMMCSCFVSIMPEANAFGDVWVKEYFTDKFGDKTDQFYITNKSQFKGTYNDDSVSKGKLGANLFFERSGDRVLAYVVLSHKGKDPVKNSTSSAQSYDIDVKRADGSQFSTSGTMRAGEDRIDIKNTIDLVNALCSGGDVSIYIENKTSNYLFKAKSDNFKEIYNNEILNPYRAEQYQMADQLLNEGKYDEAIVIFESISGYKDSAVRLAEAKEKKFLVENALVSVHEDYAKQICYILIAVIGDDLWVKTDENGNIVFGEGVFFDLGSSYIKTAAEPTLNQLVKIFSKFLADPENVRYVDSIVISCHTDSTGSDESNRQLSSDRANAILNYLLKNDAGKLKPYDSYFTAVGYGESRPVASNDTEEGRAQNRRIEISIKLKEDGTGDDAKLEKSTYNTREDYLAQIYNDLTASLKGDSNVRIVENDSIVLEGDVFFDRGSADIKPAAKSTLSQLNNAFSQLLSDPENARYVDNIVISCHTDSPGSDESNQQISSDRANAILSYLLNKDGGKLKQYASYFSAVGYGETRPVALNDTEEGRAQNRRIEITFILK